MVLFYDLRINATTSWALCNDKTMFPDVGVPMIKIVFILTQRSIETRLPFSKIHQPELLHYNVRGYIKNDNAQEQINHNVVTTKKHFQHNSYFVFSLHKL